VDSIAETQEMLGEIAAVLSGDSRDEGGLHRIFDSLSDRLRRGRAIRHPRCASGRLKIRCAVASYFASEFAISSRGLLVNSTPPP